MNLFPPDPSWSYLRSDRFDVVHVSPRVRPIPAPLKHSGDQGLRHAIERAAHGARRDYTPWSTSAQPSMPMSPRRRRRRCRAALVAAAGRRLSQSSARHRDVVSVTIFESQSGGLFIPADAGSRAGNFVTIPNQTVDRNGTITVPYAGRVRASGPFFDEVHSSRSKSFSPIGRSSRRLSSHEGQQPLAQCRAR